MKYEYMLCALNLLKLFIKEGEAEEKTHQNYWLDNLLVLKHQSAYFWHKFLKA